MTEALSSRVVIVRSARRLTKYLTTSGNCGRRKRQRSPPRAREKSTKGWDFGEACVRLPLQRARSALGPAFHSHPGLGPMRVARPPHPHLQVVCCGGFDHRGGSGPARAVDLGLVHIDVAALNEVLHVCQAAHLSDVRLFVFGNWGNQQF